MADKVLESAIKFVKKNSECFETLSMNGKPSLLESFPFVLSHVEGFREDFQRFTKLKLETLTTLNKEPDLEES